MLPTKPPRCRSLTKLARRRDSVFLCEPLCPSWLMLSGLMLLRPLIQIPLHAPGARHIAFSNCFVRCHRSQMRFVEDVSAACNMKGFSVRIYQHHHVWGNSLAGLCMFGAQIPAYARRPCHLEAARYEHCCCRGHHPSKESSSAGVRIFIEPALQSITESQRHFDHALIPVQLDDITCPCKNRAASLASAKVFVHGCAQAGIHSAFKII